MIIDYKSKSPNIDPEAFVAPDAWVIGDVNIAKDVSIFFGTVLRGDLESISVGEGTNIQEHSLLHTTNKRSPVVVGKHITIGHRAIVHGCRIGDGSLIGMGATVLDDTVVEEECIIGAGCVVKENQVIPARSLVVGVPGKIVKTLSDEDIKGMRDSALDYVQKGKDYKKILGL